MDYMEYGMSYLVELVFLNPNLFAFKFEKSRCYNFFKSYMI